MTIDFRIAAAGEGTIVDRATATDAPATDIGFDPRCIHAQGGQAVSWWQYAPDYAYIASVGGVAGCFHPVARPQGATPDIGANESTPGGATGAGGVGGTGGAGGTGGGRGGTGGGGALAGAGGTGTGGGGSTATGAAGTTGGGAGGPGDGSTGAGGNGPGPGNGGASGADEAAGEGGCACAVAGQAKAIASAVGVLELLALVFFAFRRRPRRR